MKLNLTDRSGHVLLGLIIAVVVTALLAGGLVYSWQKKQGDDKVKEVSKQAEEASTKASELEQKLTEEQRKAEEQAKQDLDAPQEWVNYASVNYNLSFFYPKSWKITDTISDQVGDFSGISLTPPATSGDILWGMQVYKSSDTTIDKIVADMGKQFTDRKVEKEKISVNGLAATKVVVTTATTPDWYYEQIIVSANGKIYTISNGAVKDDKFETFYKSIIIK
jgi:hypothetical protein